MTTKILTALFISLLLMVTAEAIYVFYPNLSHSPSVNVATLRTSMPTGTGKRSKIASPSSEFLKQPKAINQASLDYLGRIVAGELVSSTVQNVYNGTIAQVYDTPGIINQRSYVKALKLQNNKVQYYYLLFQQNLSKFTFIEASGNEEIPIRFSDLKIGDRVEITETLDLLGEEDNLQHATIKKL